MCACRQKNKYVVRRKRSPPPTFNSTFPTKMFPIKFLHPKHEIFWMFLFVWLSKENFPSLKYVLRVCNENSLATLKKVVLVNRRSQLWRANSCKTLRKWIFNCWRWQCQSSMRAFFTTHPSCQHMENNPNLFLVKFSSDRIVNSRNETIGQWFCFRQRIHIHWYAPF